MINPQELQRLLDLKDKQLAECTTTMLATTHVIDAVLAELEEQDKPDLSPQTISALGGAKLMLLATRAGK